MIKKHSLDSLERFGWRFGLETSTALLAELGNPHLSLRCIHVAGSNGKGSTCAFMASFLKHAGYKTGLYTSPHLSYIRERFRMNGLWISKSDFDRHAKRVLEACQKVKRRLGHMPTHFEALTAMAFSWFKEQKVDWVVLETGLGGRLDATNVIPHPALSLITPIGLEHQELLGKTLGKIAWEKAGILKRDCLAATLQTQKEALRVIEKTAGEREVPLWVAGKDFKIKKEGNGFRWEGPGLSKRFKLSSFSDFQMINAGLALAGIQMLRTRGIPGNHQLIQKSLLAARWPGRLEVIWPNPLVVMDGAHNPDAAKVLAAGLRQQFPKKRWIILNGFLKDKDYHLFSQWLEPLCELSIVTEPASVRSEKGESVLGAWEKAGVKPLLVKNWEKALRFALNQQKRYRLPLLITGSLYLIGDCRKALIGTKGLSRI